MKKSVLSIVMLSILGATAPVHAVTYHDPIPEVEAGLNNFGAGIDNWEEQHLGAFTYPDAHLYHKHAYIMNNEANKAPMVTSPTQIDISKVEVFGGTKMMDLYSFMRDRANIHNFVLMDNQGRIMAEDYWNGTDINTANHAMSAGKSFTSMTSAIAVEKGYFKMSDPIEKWIPEFKGTPLEGATVQHFADMRAGVRTIDAEYDDTNGYHWSMGEWSTWDWSMPLAAGYNGFDKDANGKLINKEGAHGRLDGIEDFIKVLGQNVKLGNKHGEGYNYKCVNTEILGVVTERAVKKATGLTFNEFMEKELWTKGGFQTPLAVYSDLNHGRMPYSGGVNPTARDFALMAQLMANNGKNFKGEQLIPKWFVDQVRNGDDEVKAAWKYKDNQEQIADPKGFYTNQFRTVHVNGRKISAMVGVNGQFNVIDWKTGNTLSIFSSFGKPSGPSMIATFFNVIDGAFSAAEQAQAK